MPENIRPRDLPPVTDGIVNPSSAIIVDGGGLVQKSTPLQLIDAAAPLATQADAEAGTDNVKRMSALRVRQQLLASAAEIVNAVNPLASQAEAEAGTDNSRRMSPLRTAQAITSRLANYVAQNTRPTLKGINLSPVDGQGGEMSYAYDIASEGNWYTEVAAKNFRIYRVRSDASFLQPLSIDETSGVVTLNALPLVGSSPLKTSLGLSNVDNTSDANKPVSTAVQTALNQKQNVLGFVPAPLTAPTFNGPISVSGDGGSEGGQLNLSYDPPGTGRWTLDVAGNGLRLFRTRNGAEPIFAFTVTEATGGVDFPVTPTVGTSPLRTALGFAMSLPDFRIPSDASWSDTLQRALNYIKSIGGGVIYVPQGNYTLAQPVVYSSLFPLSIIGGGSVTGTDIGAATGAGANGTSYFSYTGDPTKEAIVIESSSATPEEALKGFVLRDIMIRTNDQTKTSGGVGLAMRGLYGAIVLDNVTVVGFATGILTDDNPSKVVGGTTRCGKHSWMNVRVSRAAFQRVRLKGTCDSQFIGLECLEESRPNYDCDLFIGDGANGGRSDSLVFSKSTFISNPLSPAQYPSCNVRVEGNDTLFIAFNDCAFEQSANVGVRISLGNPPGDHNNVMLNNCWFNGHLEHCVLSINARTHIITPRGSSSSTTLPAFRFTGSPTDPLGGRIGGGVIGGVIGYAGPAGVEVVKAGGVCVIGLQGVYNGASSSMPVVLFQQNAYECAASDVRASPGAVDVRDLGGNLFVSQGGVKVPIGSLPSFTDDAAAATAGLTGAGRFYRNGSVVMVRQT